MVQRQLIDMRVRLDLFVFPLYATDTQMEFDPNEHSQQKHYLLIKYYK